MPIHEIHPDNARLAERAVNAVRLDLAGVDLIIPDITRSWMEVGALICEVNAQPQIAFRMTQPLIEQLFSKGSKIPAVLLISAAELNWQALQAALPCGKAGYASASGVWVGARQIAPAQKNGFVAGEILLNEQEAEAALIRMAPDDVSRLGLPCDSCDALVIAAADSWDIADRNRLSSIIAIAGPHAKQTIHTPSSGADSGAIDGRYDASPEEVCAALLAAAIAAA